MVIHQSMLKYFKTFISANLQCQPQDKILVTVSGGIDSVAMAELFHRAGYRIGIAHCNFGLRGKESNGDETLVARLAESFGAPFYVKKFNPEAFSHLQGHSVQMAARELRYRWFEEVRATEGYDYIAAAHHLDDQTETFFINLLRGTGIAGLHGILPIQGKLIRPMLFATRSEITNFVAVNKLEYRDDSSNSSLKYVRNKIRHELIKILQEINPGITESLQETIMRLREFEAIGSEAVEKRLRKIRRKKAGITLIDIEGLKALQPINTFAWELLSPFGFSHTQIRDIIRSLKGESGRQFISATHRLLRDREELIIMEMSGGANKRSCGRVEKQWTDAGNGVNDSSAVYTIDKGIKRIEVPVKLRINLKDHFPGLQIPAGKEFASVDYHKLEFPLTLRRWRTGDAFYPFGMTRKQKLSDFLINAKISVAAKENIWLLCSGEKIVWVVGHRIDNRFRINQKTQSVLQIKVSL